VSLRKLYDSIYAVDQMSVRKHIAMGPDGYDGAKTTYTICYLSEFEYAAKGLIGI